MITGEELRGIRIFSALPPDALDFLSRTIEDIHLAAGEYFVHEGDARALFVVIEGRIEITKVVNGEERTIGERTPGQFFGEVPMTLSTNFPASGRAPSAARIIKLDVTGYYSLAAMAPSVPAKVAWLARRYLDAIQALAAEPPDATARVIGNRNDVAARALSTFLTRNGVAFDRVVTEEGSPQAADADTHTILKLRDGRTLRDPPLRDAARAVGLHVEPSSTDYDVVILGAGPAGLTAAVNAAAEGLRTVVIERLAPGGQAGTSTRIENYTGFPYGISGDDLASRALTQAMRLGAEIVVTRTAQAIGRTGTAVMLDGAETVAASALIIATGVEWRTLPVDGVERYLGNGVYYGAARSDSAVAQGRDVCIIGAGNSAGQAALFFSRHARTVTMLVRGQSLEASMSRYLIDQIAAADGIRVEMTSQVVALHGERALEGVDVLNTTTGETSTRALPVLFVMIGANAVTDWLGPEIARDSHGFICTGADAAASAQWVQERRPFALETSCPGVFAIGDVRSGSVKRVAAGVGEGGMAIAFTHQYLALTA